MGEVVLDIRHTKDIADIDELLVFRIAMVPKTWNDKYNDPQTTTVEDLSNCLNHMPMIRRSSIHLSDELEPSRPPRRTPSPPTRVHLASQTRRSGRRRRRCPRRNGLPSRPNVRPDSTDNKVNFVVPILFTHTNKS